MRLTNEPFPHVSTINFDNILWLNLVVIPGPYSPKYLEILEILPNSKAI